MLGKEYESKGGRSGNTGISPDVMYGDIKPAIPPLADEYARRRGLTPRRGPSPYKLSPTGVGGGMCRGEKADLFPGTPSAPGSPTEVRSAFV